MSKKTPQISQKNGDIAIIGGGIAGLVLCILCGRAGFTVHLVEPYAPPPPSKTTPSGRTVALMGRALSTLKKTGVWETILPHAGTLKTMRIIDDSIAGAPVADTDFDSTDVDLHEFGFNIPNSYLRASLFEYIQALDMVTIHETFMTTYTAHESHVDIDLDDNTCLKTSILVGADGRNSRVRELANIKVKTHNYDQIAITCLINHSRTHENTATEFHRPGGPLALVPLPDNQSSIVWVNPTKRAQALLSLKKQEFVTALQESMDNCLGGITLESDPESWPLSSMQATCLTARRIALIAEAAHVLPPITAQGLNLSLRDVSALINILHDAAYTGMDIGSDIILKKYERSRRHDIRTRSVGVDIMNRAVKQDSTFTKSIRRFGLKTVDSLAPLKILAMEHGLHAAKQKS